MQAIEFVQFNAQGDGLEVKNEEYNKRVNHVQQEWDETHDSLLSQSIPDDFREISASKVNERVTSTIDEIFSPIDEIAPELLKQPSRQFLFRRNLERPRVTLWCKEDTAIVPIPEHTGNIFIVTNNKDVGRDARERLIDNISEREEYLNLYGVENINISKGNKFAEEVISNYDNVTSVNEGEPDEFEKATREKLKSVTESILCSCEIDFGGYPANPEYDILIPIGYDNIINIEVKDYSVRDESPNEDEIIDKPLKQARLLNINQVFSIAKGIDDELRQNFEESVELRDDIQMARKDDIAEKVRKYVQNEILQGVLWPLP